MVVSTERVKALVTNKLTASSVEQINRLVELLEKPQYLNKAEIEQILVQPQHVTYVARHADDTIVGMLVASYSRLPQGNEATIHFVAVDKSFNGQGYGADLFRAAIAWATEPARRIKRLYVALEATRREERRIAEDLGFQIQKGGRYRLNL